MIGELAEEIAGDYLSFTGRGEGAKAYMTAEEYLAFRRAAAEEAGRFGAAALSGSAPAEPVPRSGGAGAASIQRAKRSPSAEKPSQSERVLPNPPRGEGTDSRPGKAAPGPADDESEIIALMRKVEG